MEMSATAFFDSERQAKAEPVEMPANFWEGHSNLRPLGIWSDPRPLLIGILVSTLLHAPLVYLVLKF